MYFKPTLCLLLLCLSWPLLFAQTIDVEKLGGLEYRLVGPHRGGRVTAACGVPQQPFTFYFGATGGGVWKTADGGLSWSNVSDGYFRAGSIGAVAVAPSDPNVVYAGTGSAEPRGNVSLGVGLYRSTDGGDSWTHIGLDKAGLAGKIVVHPRDPDVVYTAVLGNIFGPNPERGVYRSTDGGKQWEQVLFISERTGAIDLVMDPTNPRILYAGMWTAERKPWTLIDGSTEGGVWKSKDGGDTWERLTGGLPQGLVGKVGIAVSPVNPKRVWVIQEAKEESQGGLYASEDGGQSFQRINGDHELRQRAWYYNRIYAHPTEEQTLFLCNVGFHKSTDGGNTFERISTPHNDNHVLWINPDNPDIMIEGNDGGACVTFNGGQTWTTQLNQPTAEFYRISLDNQFPYRLYGAQQDNSTISIPSRFDAAITPEQLWYAVGGGESGHIAIHPDNPDIIYAGTYIGQITRMDRSRGYTQDVMAYPQMHDGTAPRDIKYRFQWNAPIRISPHDPNKVYHCSQYVHRTTDGGRSWEVISPDLTTDKDGYHDIPGGPIQHDHTGVELYTTIFAFEESPHRAGELWAGSDDGLLHLSRDDGGHWKDITPPGLPTEGTINCIELSAHAPGRALIAVYKYREDDFRPYIFLTDDYGESWRLLTDGKNGIPESHFVRVVREDPNRRGLLYAGTEYGLYLSFDEGQHWQPFQLNLPVVPITDMAIRGDDLALATQGRSFWILDGLSPLHHLDERLLSGSAHLFPIRTAYRTQFRNFSGPNAPDPAPNGGLIYFYLKEADSTATLSILGPAGKPRRTFSVKPNKEKGEEPLDIRPGLNRLEWGLLFEKPETLEDAVFSLANTGGIKAPPGAYEVVLQAGGQEYRQSLLLEADPRWECSTADLQAQYELAMQAKALLNECHAAIGRLRSIRSQVEAVAQRSLKPEMNDTAAHRSQAIIDTLSALEAELIQTRSQSSQDPINYPPRLDDQIAYLYSFINEQDSRPTAGAYERYRHLKAALQPHLDTLENIIAEEVAPFNKALEDMGVQVIATE